MRYINSRFSYLLTYLLESKQERRAIVNLQITSTYS